MFKPSHKKKTSINIIPMIDVIFFLLVFFMLFTTFRTNPFGLEMQLPEAVTATEQKEEHIVININENGEFFHEENQVSISELRNNIADSFNENPNLTVILNSDKNARYEHIITVMDNLRKIGVYNIFLAAERREG